MIIGLAISKKILLAISFFWDIFPFRLALMFFSIPVFGERRREAAAAATAAAVARKKPNGTSEETEAEEIEIDANIYLRIHTDKQIHNTHIHSHRADN